METQRDRIMQHVQPNTQGDSAQRLRTHGQGDGSGISQQRAVELEPVRDHAVLPVGPGAFAAGNRRRTQELRRQAGPFWDRSADTLVAVLRQRAPDLATVREGVLWTVRGCRGQGRRQKEVPLQEQAGQPGFDRDRPVPVDVRLGEIPPHQGRGQAPSGARS